jgi:hypothetical protein
MSDKTKVMASGGISEAAGRHKPVLVVAGPTASGKSALAARLARDFGGIVINADSMQVYRDLPILTAQPSAAAKAAVPHRLYGFLALDDVCSADRWATLARQEIGAAHDSGKLPILCGGTGLYLRALMHGFSPIPEVPAGVRQAARDLLEQIGSVALRERLAAGDPVSAARLHANDRQRIARAWEVLQATGRPISEWQALPPVEPRWGRRFVVENVDLYASVGLWREGRLTLAAWLTSYRGVAETAYVAWDDLVPSTLFVSGLVQKTARALYERLRATTRSLISRLRRTAQAVS